jgi:hypothetical protein
MPWMRSPSARTNRNGIPETQALLDQSAANAEQWRQLCEAAQNRAVVDSVCDQIKPVKWVGELS